MQNAADRDGESSIAVDSHDISRGFWWHVAVMTKC